MTTQADGATKGERLMVVAKCGGRKISTRGPRGRAEHSPRIRQESFGPSQGGAGLLQQNGEETPVGRQRRSFEVLEKKYTVQKLVGGG